MLGFSQRCGGASPFDFLLLLCLLLALFALNGSICSFCRADIVDELTGSSGAGTRGVKDLESLGEYLNYFYTPKGFSSCRRGELPTGLTVV